MFHVDTVKQVLSINSQHNLNRNVCISRDTERGKRHTVDPSIARSLSCHGAECGTILTVHLVLRASFSSSFTSTSWSSGFSVGPDSTSCRVMYVTETSSEFSATLMARDSPERTGSHQFFDAVSSLKGANQYGSPSPEDAFVAASRSAITTRVKT